ncbi:hypothetical protein CEXT_662521 [Caerostris extrusa]|uniref:Uncharacterized protein n=1 Tax=Caerostris extrusa TaxID=172846 RepID=A0AAV4VBT2_CAEEX|nr:hypothetical protein CEXT_662521 [Caerostris extrusa]
MFNFSWIKLENSLHDGSDIGCTANYGRAFTIMWLMTVNPLAASSKQGIVLFLYLVKLSGCYEISASCRARKVDGQLRKVILHHYLLVLGRTDLVVKLFLAMAMKTLSANKQRTTLNSILYHTTTVTKERIQQALDRDSIESRLLINLGFLNPKRRTTASDCSDSSGGHLPRPLRVPWPNGITDPPWGRQKHPQKGKQINAWQRNLIWRERKVVRKCKCISGQISGVDSFQHKS